MSDRPERAHRSDALWAEWWMADGSAYWCDHGVTVGGVHQQGRDSSRAADSDRRLHRKRESFTRLPPTTAAHVVEIVIRVVGGLRPDGCNSARTDPRFHLGCSP